MSDGPVIVEALIEAGRRALLLDPLAAQHLLQATRQAGITRTEDLVALLDGGLPGVPRSHLLSRLLNETGQRYGSWTILSQLPNAAANAHVGRSYLAHDAHGRLGLLRILPCDPNDADAQTHDRFARELRLCRTLDHPHLVPWLDADTSDDGDLWFVLDHQPASDLALRLHSGALDERTTLDIGAQIASGLIELDRLGLVHRAIAPSSILLSGDGTARLGEFGLMRTQKGIMTRIHSESAESRLWWQAPELLTGMGQASPASDIYALGCVLYACLTARPPFVGEAPEIIHGHIERAPPPFADLMRLPPQPRTDQLIQACLAKDPAARPKARALADDLHTARAPLKEPLGRRHSEPGTNSSSRRITRSVRRSLALAGSLDEVHLGDLLQTLQRLQANGTLTLESSAGYQEIAVQKGLPVGLGLKDPESAAELRERLADALGHDPLELHRLLDHTRPDDLPAAVLAAGLSAKALSEALTAQLFDVLCRHFTSGAGAFRFTATSEGDRIPYAEQALTLHPEHLAMEAVRQIDESNRLLKHLPGPWAIPVLDGPTLSLLETELVLYPERGLVTAIDGLTPLAELHRPARCSHYAAISCCTDLQERGLLGWLEPNEARRQAASLLAQSALTPALDLARAALAARPGDPGTAAAYAACLLACDHPGEDSGAHLAIPLGRCIGDLDSALRLPWISLLSRPDGRGAAIHLYSNPELVLGKLARAPVDVALRVYPERDFREVSNLLSRLHCRLRWHQASVTIADLGSSNGSCLDGVSLVADSDYELVGRESHLVLGGAVTLILRRVGGWEGLPPPLDPPPDEGLGAVVLQRQGNRPELVYASVRTRVVIGGPGSELALPGATLGQPLVLSRQRERWLWAHLGDKAWRPLVQGQTLSICGRSFTVACGDHTLFH